MSTDMPNERPSGIALDLGGTKIAAARIRDGVVIQRLMQSTDGAGTPESHVARMFEMARDLGLTADDRIGMAVTGRIDAAGFWHAVNAATLTDVQNANLLDLAQTAFGRPVPILNDALAAALAEYRFGAGQGSRAMAYITVSTGVGGGIVMDGRPLVTDSGLVGHVGFSTSRLSSRRCGSGRIGTVESVAGGRAIAAIAAGRGHRVSTAKEVFGHWRAGDAWAVEIVDTAAAAIAELIGNLTAILGLDRVVLGGSIGLADGFAGRVRHFIADEPVLFRAEVTTAGLEQDSVLLGALVGRGES